jgi:hypothetical protein
MPKQFLKKNNNIVVFAGLLVGLGAVMNILPMELIGSSTKFLYAGIILLAGYCFYEFHMNRSQGMPPQQKLPPRDLNNPDYQRKVRQLTR